MKKDGAMSEESSSEEEEEQDGKEHLKTYKHFY